MHPNISRINFIAYARSSLQRVTTFGSFQLHRLQQFQKIVGSGSVSIIEAPKVVEVSRDCCYLVTNSED